MPDEQDLNIDFFYFRRDGIQDSVFQHLKRGQPAPQQGIDLHGMTREIALRELESFISECQDRHVKHILIIHGKGGKSEQRAVLKPSVAIWLRQMPSVLAFCPAMPRDGGDGALYVLLKKQLNINYPIQPEPLYFLIVTIAPGITDHSDIINFVILRMVCMPVYP